MTSSLLRKTYTHFAHTWTLHYLSSTCYSPIPLLPSCSTRNIFPTRKLLDISSLSHLNTRTSNSLSTHLFEISTKSICARTTTHPWYISTHIYLSTSLFLNNLLPATNSYSMHISIKLSTLSFLPGTPYLLTILPTLSSPTLLFSYYGFDTLYCPSKFEISK